MKAKEIDKEKLNAFMKEVNEHLKWMNETYESIDWKGYAAMETYLDESRCYLKRFMWELEDIKEYKGYE